MTFDNLAIEEAGVETRENAKLKPSSNRADELSLYYDPVVLWHFTDLSNGV